MEKDPRRFVTPPPIRSMHLNKGDVDCLNLRTQSASINGVKPGLHLHCESASQSACEFGSSLNGDLLVWRQEPLWLGVGTGTEDSGEAVHMTKAGPTSRVDRRTLQGSRCHAEPPF